MRVYVENFYLQNIIDRLKRVPYQLSIVQVQKHDKIIYHRRF